MHSLEKAKLLEEVLIAENIDAALEMASQKV
jgi:hypothetical protein